MLANVLLMHKTNLFIKTTVQAVKCINSIFPYAFAFNLAEIMHLLFDNGVNKQLSKQSFTQYLQFSTTIAKTFYGTTLANVFFIQKHIYSLQLQLMLFIMYRFNSNTCFAIEFK